MRTVLVVTPPGVCPVTRAEVKAHLRVDHDDEDAVIDGLIAAASALLDGPQGGLNRALITQGLELRLDTFPCFDTFACGGPNIGVPVGAVALPCPPYQAGSLVVTYVDTAGVVRTVSPAVYRVVGGGHPSPSYLVLAYGQVWPATRCEPEAVRIAFDAGYGDAGTDVPAPIRAALKLIVAHLYANRDGVVSSARGGVTLAELPFGIQRLLSPYVAVF